MKNKFRKFYPGAKPKQKSYHLGSPVPDDTMVEAVWNDSFEKKYIVGMADMFDWTIEADYLILKYRVMTDELSFQYVEVGLYLPFFFKTKKYKRMIKDARLLMASGKKINAIKLVRGENLISD